MKKDLKRLRDLYPELKKEFDPLNPNPQQNSQKVVRHLINKPDAPVINPIDFDTADSEIHRYGLDHPKKVSKLNSLRRKLGINQV